MQCFVKFLQYVAPQKHKSKICKFYTCIRQVSKFWNKKKMMQRITEFCISFAKLIRLYQFT